MAKSRESRWNVWRPVSRTKRPGRGWGSGSARRAPLRFHLERLEDRLVLSADFGHTDPEPDPDSVVGEAGIEAQDDYYTAAAETAELRLDVLGNDPLPGEATSLSIKSVSATARGVNVSISDDGHRIIYSPGEDGIRSDTFYYIVEDDAGNLGKANVNIRVDGPRVISGLPTNNGAREDRITVYEDTGESQLDVLANDRQFHDGEIIEVTSSRLGDVRIADDGNSLYYQPHPATSGSEILIYTVRNADGETSTARVYLTVSKPIEAWREDNLQLHAGTGSQVLDPLANDHYRQPTPQTPQIVDVTFPDYVGQLNIVNDGQQVEFLPAEGFIGAFSYEYTVRYGPAEYQTSSANGWIDVFNAYLAVDDWVATEIDTPVEVHPLANDPILSRWDFADVTLRVIDTTQGEHGGTVEMLDGGQLRYTPTAGFVGDDTFSYTVDASNGVQDTATVTVHVAEPLVDPSGVPKFIVPGELQQYLIDRAVEAYSQLFGATRVEYQLIPYVLNDYQLDSNSADVSGTIARDYSETNTQEAGVDEADIVEVDGRWLYRVSGGELAIVYIEELDNPQLESLTDVGSQFTEMYLQGDRLTLINRGSHRDGKYVAEVLVLDVTNRSASTVVERTEIDGRIVDTRAVGDRVYVAVSADTIPGPASHEIADGDPDGLMTIRKYETLDEFVARLRTEGLASALPMFRTYDGSDQLVAEGLLTHATDIHKPIGSQDRSLLSLVTFDAGDAALGPLSSVGIYTESAAEVYMNGDAFYVLAGQAGGTTIFKFTTVADGSSQLVATGHVDGWLLNQFSVDEHDGRLRIATTQVVYEVVPGSDGRFVRQQRRFTNLFVLEQSGAELAVVGRIENLAPTEAIKSVRFLDDRAYVTTFRVVDPLFAVDLSEPTNPTVEGALKIPGYSDYLHPVGEDYLIGIGRDADEITGRVGLPQISLFYVGDLSAPTLVDQVTMEDVAWANSEALWDHHAVAYFAGHHVLTIPVSWQEPVTADDPVNWTLGGSLQWWQPHYESAVWVFEIDTDGAGGGAIDVTGNVSHDGTARRSVRYADALLTISDNGLKINQLHDPSQQVGELYLGPLPAADRFTVDEDSHDNVLDVRANDHSGSTGEPPRIVDVTQPTPALVQWGTSGPTDPVGTVEISDDGGELLFTPIENFFGTVTFTYTVRDAIRGEQQATVSVTVVDVPEAVDDRFEIDPGSVAVELDVLANDASVDKSHTGAIGSPIYAVPDSNPYIVWSENLITTDVLTFQPDVAVIPSLPLAGVRIIEVGPTRWGGVVEITTDGQKLLYTPANGFRSVDSFTYTVENSSDRTATATVTVQIGDPSDVPVVLGWTAVGGRQVEGNKTSQRTPRSAVDDAADNLSALDLVRARRESRRNERQLHQRLTRREVDDALTELASDGFQPQLTVATDVIRSLSPELS